MKPKFWKSALSLALLGGAVLAPMAYVTTIDSNIETVETTNDVNSTPDSDRIVNQEAINNDNDNLDNNDDLNNNVTLEQGAFTYSDGTDSHLMLTLDATELTPEDLGGIASSARVFYRVKEEGSSQWGHWVPLANIQTEEINYYDISMYKDEGAVEQEFVDGETYEIELYVTTTSDGADNFDPEEDGYVESLGFTWTHNGTEFSDPTEHTVDQPLFEFTNVTSAGNGVTIELVSTLGWGDTSLNYTITGYDITVTNLSNAGDGIDTNDTITTFKTPSAADGGNETFGINITSLYPEVGDQLVVSVEMLYTDVPNSADYSYTLDSDVITVTDFQPATVEITDPTFTDDGNGIDAEMEITINDPDEVLQLGGFPGGADTAIAFTGGNGFVDTDYDGLQDETEGTVVAVNFTETGQNEYVYELHIDDLEYGTKYYVTMETLQYTDTSGVALIFDYKEFETPADPNPETDKLDGWVIPVVSTLGALLVIALGWLAYATFLKRKYKKHRLTPEEKMDCQIKGQILELNAMKISELRKEADALKIADTKGKNKTELINMIVAHFFNPEALENPKEMEEIEKTTELVMSEIVK